MIRFLVLLMFAFSLTGCWWDRAPAQAPATVPPAEKKIPPAEAPVLHDLDHQLSIGTRISAYGTGIGIAAAIFLALEVHAFVRAAIALALGSLGAFAVLSVARLALPLVAIALPWALGAAILLAVGCVALWFSNRRFRRQMTSILHGAMGGNAP